jgi:iron complex transport system substrate-binding protein
VRVVSLLASATEIVCALGAGEMLVGRSHECDNPFWVRRLPPCSEPAFDVSVSSGEIDAEVRRRLRAGEPLYIVHDHVIARLQPDLIITQEHCEVCAVTPANIRCPAGKQLAISASSVEDIFESVVQIARALDLEDRGHALVEQERKRLQSVRDRTAGLRKPTLVMLEWTDPIFGMAN